MDQTLKQIEKGIRRLDKRIKEHQDKIKDPKKGWESSPKNNGKKWEDLSPEHQGRVIEGWKNDINRLKEMKDIYKSVRDERINPLINSKPTPPGK